MSVQRLIVIFQGRVQGVGFRQTAVEIARQFAVTGTVANLPDGDVELVAHGDTDELHAFVAAIEKQMARNIRKVIRRPGSGEPDFADFSIVR